MVLHRILNESPIPRRERKVLIHLFPCIALLLALSSVSCGRGGTQAAKSDLGSLEIRVPTASIRKGNTTESAVIAKLSSGHELRILSEDKGWYKVRLPDGKVGWVWNELVKPLTDEMPDLGARIMVGSASLKEDRASESRNMAALSKGDNLTLLQISEGWYRLRLPDGTEGWIKADEAKVEPRTRLRIARAGVRARTGPGEDYDATSPLPEGSDFGLYSLKGRWYRIIAPDGKEGWVKDSDARLSPVGGLRVSAPEVAIRDGRGEGYRVIAKAEEGEVVGVINRRGLWYQVETKDGRVGWVDGQGVEIEPVGSIEVVRSGAAVVRSPSSGVESLSAGSTVTIVEAAPGGYRVRLPDGREGTISSDALPSRRGPGEQLVVKSSVANVRSGPDRSYEVIGGARRGQELQVLSQDRGWYQVRLPDGKVGWMSGNVAGLVGGSPSGPLQRGQAVSTVREAALELASEAEGPLAVVDKSAILPLLASEGGWYRVRLPSGEEGWVRKDSVRLLPMFTVSTSTAETPVMDVPDVKGGEVKVAEAGSTLEVIDASEGWYKVRLPSGEEGWVAKNRLSENPSGKAQVVSKAGASIRSGPGLKYKNLGGVKAGEELNVLEDMWHWVRVRSGEGVEGWVKSEDVKSLPKGQVIVSAPSGVVRKGPTDKYSEIAVVKGGDRLDLVAQMGGQSKVRLSDGREGWMSLASLAPSAEVAKKTEPKIQIPKEQITNTQITKEGVQVAKGLETDSVPSADSQQIPKGLKTQIPIRIKVSAATANVRTNPGRDSSILDTVKGGLELEVVGEEEGWYQVRLPDGRQAWISKRITQPLPEDVKVVTLPEKVEAGREEPKTEVEIKDSQGVVVASVAQLHEGPGENYPRAAEAKKGDRLNLSGQTGNWYKAMTADSRSAWVRGDDIKVLGPPRADEVLTDKKVVIDSPTAQIHSGPDPDYPVVRAASKGEKFKASGKRGDWYQVELSEGESGWVSEKEAHSDRIKEAYAEVGVNLRKGPGLNYEVIEPLKAGESVRVAGKAGAWYRITESDGGEGWVWSGAFSESERKAVESKSPPSGRASVQAPSLREEASLDSREVAQLRPGDKLEVLDRAGNWYKLKTPSGREGWAWGDARVQDDLGGWKEPIVSSSVSDGEALVLFNVAIDFYNQEAYKLAKGNFLKLVEEYPRSSQAAEAFEYLSGIDDKIKGQEIDSLIAKLDPELMKLSVGHVVHVSLMGEVFVDLGSDHGIKKGERLRVMRKGTEAELSVIRINQVHSGKLSSGTVVAGARASQLGKGDIVKKIEGS